MKLIVFFIFIFCASINVPSFANQIDYNSCRSIHDVIKKETEEIVSTHKDNRAELAQLYVSRGESYLLDTQYQLAIEDFQKAHSLIDYCENTAEATSIAFRAIFGEVICFDNLEMPEETQHALKQFQLIATQLSCIDVKEDCRSQKQTSSPFQAKTRSNNAEQSIEIIGPNYNVSGWCEEVVTGTAEAMRLLAALAKTKTAKIALLATISGLETRCLKCCETGEFWKVCVAPIVEKWKEWNDKYQFLRIPPDPAWDDLD